MDFRMQRIEHSATVSSKRRMAMMAVLRLVQRLFPSAGTPGAQGAKMLGVSAFVKNAG
jgi:hypothetical protein